MKKVNVKEAKGITLVALVITVIILLILAGVALSLVIGENGLIKKSKEGVGVYKQSAENETTQWESFEEEFTNLQQPKFTTVANAPDISGFNKNNTYYVEWDTTSSPYNINESTKISGIAPSNWYDYTEGVNKWANVKTTGGGNDCYWVWIPRYAYKVPTKGNTAETIEIKFLQGKTKIPIGETEEIINTTPTPGTWVVHPAFTNEGNGGLGELTGIWVAKYEASSNSSSVVENPTESQLAIDGGSDADTDLKVRVKPNVTSWRKITVNNIFTVCRNLTETGNSLENTSNLDSHMMKNTEWGAVAYLSSSKYGKTDAEGNRVRVWNNPYYNNTTNYSPITGLCGKGENKQCLSTTNLAETCKYNEAGGENASTTGNVYGIYDMAGGAGDLTAAIYTGGSKDDNISNLWDSNAKYVDQYTKTTGSRSTYYDNTSKYGDAVYETSSSGDSGTGSWDATNSYFPASNYPVFVRGGGAYGGSFAGVFAFVDGTGGAFTRSSFRPVVLSSQSWLWYLMLDKKIRIIWCMGKLD